MRVLAITLAAAALLGAGVASSTENDSLRQHILRGLDYGYREDYDSARSEFARAIDIDPDDPSGYFFLCGLWGLYMSDFSSEDVDGLLAVKLSETIEAAKKRIEADSTDGWPHFYLGGAYAYSAYTAYRRGGKWSAFSHALAAVGELKKCVALDSTIYDAYMGIGSYHYFVDRLWSYVPFLGRNPEKGIREIRLAVDKGIFVNVAAQEGLAQILIREKRYDEALALAENLLARYPRSRTFRWTLGKVREEKGEWALAAGIYRDLFSMIEKGQPGNYYNLACCGHRLAYCLYRMREYEEARSECTAMLKLLENPYDHDGIEGLRKDLSRLLNDIQKAAR